GPEKSCCHQERIWRRFSGESFRLDDVAIHPHLEEIIQFGGFQHGRAILTRRHNSDLEPVAAELMNESHAPVVRLHSFAFDEIVNQLILAVPQSAYGFELRRIMRMPLGELNSARAQEIPNPVETRLSIDVEPIVRGEIKGPKCLSALLSAPAKIFVEHLLPTGRVEGGGVGYDTIEIKEDSIVPLVCDVLALGLRHELLSCYPSA